MAQYMVEAKHDPAKCTATLDEMAKTKILSKFDWGCPNEHVGYAILEGESESAIRKMLPSDLREGAHIVKVNKLTPEQIKSFHEKK